MGNHYDPRDGEPVASAPVPEPPWIDGLALRHATRLDHSPCLAPAVLEWASLLNRGLVPPREVNIHESYPVVWATHAVDSPVNPIGFIIYSTYDTGGAWTRLGAVNAPYRRRGVYRAMYAHLRRICADAGVVTLIGGIHPRNVEATRMAMALGRVPMFVAYADDLTRPNPALDAPSRPEPSDPLP